MRRQCLGGAFFFASVKKGKRLETSNLEDKNNTHLLRDAKTAAVPGLKLKSGQTARPLPVERTGDGEGDRQC